MRTIRPRLLQLYAGCALLALALLSIGAVRASSGDRQLSFRSCVANCQLKECIEPAPLPLHLRLLLWTCESNCDYKCQRHITHNAQAHGRRVHQYHGKWPFIRMLGVQEPASVVFSVLNGLMHIKSWRLVQTLPRVHPMRLWLSVFVVLGSWSWFCSAVFHTRDFPLTEKLDYFSAGLNVLYIFFLGSVRMLRLSCWRKTRVVAVCCAVPYVLHVAYLSLVKFDYGYNMMANAIVGLLSNVVWFVVTFQAYRNGQPFWWKPAVLIVLTDLAFSLEAFDFPPFADTFDAHSLWHAATVPIVAQWYSYLVDDARWDARLEQLRKD
ncbi:hypothetical protein IWW55_003980 [Coemansia sp. RSA 2706]|nr:hypothetical protein LPJ63_000678 [Coemansia sp. RSA 2711]KAJ2300375.1 hypothetical protein IWW55_003980 [Coemansia sp. RSA 2706]KAJ2305848.1 hypothetical protein IWW54_004948 [Coemansia sp. RSA 2705]KAJ2312923.1 hypothetical protein IWW52_004722 [Coemansia sp. RSA 2704]KAJ2324967.1 hypothetical protein IWW51_003020 [Coemansia sp. RSA 2702]KAJ2368747.1 hypothetical protein H4S01_001416 [Coemansia sp. RSA 2610]KAJ2393091.1 hypothetical protein H4S02_000420 [Coemansia sp. RSA 2611]KAJ272131